MNIKAQQNKQVTDTPCRKTLQNPAILGNISLISARKPGSQCAQRAAAGSEARSKKLKAES
jgi:hypothetical protein